MFVILVKKLGLQVSQIDYPFKPEFIDQESWTDTKLKTSDRVDKDQ